MHWGGVTNRFSEEDTRLKSMFGLAVDWPIAWTELERYYCDAERRLGVSGDPSPLPEDARSEPYPMTGHAAHLEPRAAQDLGREERHPVLGHAAGEEHRPYDGRGECKRCNTCSVCPTEARYAPDFTFKQLLEAQGHHAARSHAGAEARRSPTAAAARPRIEAATGLHRDRPNDVGDLPREDLRRRLGLHLELAPAAALGLEPVPERRRQLVGAGRQVHERPRLHPDATSSSTPRSIPG